MNRAQTIPVGHISVCDGRRPIKRLVLTEPGPDEVEDFDRHEDAEEWVVVLLVPGNRINEENVEITTIDNTEGGEGHIDDGFLPDDAIPEGNKVVWFNGSLSLREAEIIAERNAEHWAEIYRHNHELPKKK